MTEPNQTAADAGAPPASALDANATHPAAEPRQLSFREELIDNIRFLGILLVCVIVFRSFFLTMFNIPSESMQPRLLIGDYLLVNKMAYGYSRHSLPFSAPLIPGQIFAALPERGDVAVFKAPPGDRADYIKRVIGLPGDMVEVRGGILWLNGAPVPRRAVADLVIPVTANMDAAAGQTGEHPCYRPDFEETGDDGRRYCRYPQFRETLPNGKSYAVLDLVRGQADDFAPVMVPDGHVFMMGDNRDRSADSRFPAVEGYGIGMVPVENLMGRALVSMFYTDGSASWVNPISWFTAARFERVGQGF